MRSEILSIHTAALFAEAVGRAAELLRCGQLVALPTETVYGLAANAWDPGAVRRIYDVKERPLENPVIVHVAGMELARRCASNWPPLADKMAAAFWPGPLTLVVPRSEEIPAVVTAGGGTVGVRWPSHPFIQAVIGACGFPLAAPSANRANQLSPTTAQHVWKSLGDKIPLIVDGGQSQVGIESSVLDLSSSPPRLLRPGMIHAESLLAVIGGGDLEVGGGPTGALRSPGLLPRHYSPRAKLVVLDWTDEADLAARVSGFGFPRQKIHVVTHTRIPLREKFGRVAIIARDAQAYARAIYAELHQCDEAGAELIIAEVVPEGREWRGIADRLRRAAHGHVPGGR
ncbi:MAG TPA: L-threonylcarbamoyladenylate synthase [Candidatus Baltobacteraceae bacterium]|jgi:L-threonylcarbamoyladenylate synthase|nr:L-threonylcarbamoyladenylate synthase [Candidatus Baltobacteraceae bacterium]